MTTIKIESSEDLQSFIKFLEQYGFKVKREGKVETPNILFYYAYLEGEKVTFIHNENNR